MSDFENKVRDDDFGGLAEAKGEIFTKFKKKSQMAKYWIDDLIKYGYRTSDKKGRKSFVDEGLFMSDEEPEVGVLSITPSLSALLFELSLLKDKDESIEGNGFEERLADKTSNVLYYVINSICKMFAECFPNGVDGGNGKILFSSMPFYDDTNASKEIRWDESGGYLDSASWVFLVADLIESFLKRMGKEAPELYKTLKWEVKRIDENNNVKIEKLTTDNVLSAVRALYIESVKVTCDCIIERDNKVLGWTFRHMGGDAEPSLYFSYIASTVYLGLYKRFNIKKIGDIATNDGMIDKLRRLEEGICPNGNVAAMTEGSEVATYRFYENITDKDTRDKHIEWLHKRGATELEKFLSELSDEEIEAIDFLYNKINNGYPLTYNIGNKIDSKTSSKAFFKRLKDASIEFADTIWNEGFGNQKTKVPFKTNMAKGPCFENGTLVDMDVVRLSSHNNAFFNNLFVIGIILNSAYDLELLKRGKESEYKRMFNIFELAIQNTQRCYNEIDDEGLLYKIDSYILDFSDKVDDKNVELAKQLRKVNISAVPLLPLMLKSNNLMSQYVVRYPQKQMTESLERIINNRKEILSNESGKKTQIWVWDKDGYNAITNYYYIDALIAFYRYYEEFEEIYVDKEINISAIEKRVANEKEKELDVYRRSLDDKYEKELKWRDGYIEQTRILGKNLAQFIVNGLIDLVDEQLSDKILLAGLAEGDDMSNRDNIIKELNSFDKETDAVKITKLVHLTEKLQLLSLLSMKNNNQIITFLKNGDQARQDSHLNMIRSIFGARGDSSKFMANLVTYLAGRSSGASSEDKKND